MTGRNRMAEGDAPGNRTARRLLGQVLVDGEFISAGELERALEEQNGTNELLGEVLVRMGVVDPGEITGVVAIQLEEALEERRQTGERLGQILVRRGLLTERQLDVALAFQRAQAGEAPASVRLQLGEILVARGQVTREQLDTALARQKLVKKDIGDLLVESGAVRRDQVRQGRKLQKKLVTAALAAAFSLAEIAGAQETPPQGKTLGYGTAPVLVTARVLPRATLTVLHQNAVLQVTPEDVSRGYVDAPDASRIEVRENSPAGCLLVFVGTGVEGSVFSRVTVRGLGREVEIGPEGGFVPYPHSAAPYVGDLSYRFSLAKDIRPGTYSWPLSVSVRPL